MFYKIEGARPGSTIYTSQGWVAVSLHGTAVIHSKEQVAELKGMGFALVKYDGKPPVVEAVPPADNTNRDKRLEEARTVGQQVTHQEMDVLAKPRGKREKAAAAEGAGDGETPDNLAGEE